jgi:hypothetical protein
MPYDIGDDDDVGALMDVGAARRVLARAGARRQTPANLRSRPALMSAYPGAPPVAEKQIPLGFGNQAFTSTSTTTLTFTARPQAVFRGRRLVIDFSRTGATATGLVTLTSMLIGTRNQLVGTLGIPVSTFASGAFGVDMALDPATPGIDITLVMVISAAPGTTDRVDIGASLIGTGIQ